MSEEHFYHIIYGWFLRHIDRLGDSGQMYGQSGGLGDT